MSEEGHPSIPFYWTQDQSTVLKSIVQRFLRNETLSHSELKILRWYLYQWVESHPLKPSNAHWIQNMTQEELKKYLIDVLLKDYKITPF